MSANDRPPDKESTTNATSNTEGFELIEHQNHDRLLHEQADRIMDELDKLFKPTLPPSLRSPIPDDPADGEGVKRRS